METVELLTIEEAVQYVRKQKGVEISPAALSRRITRGLPFQRNVKRQILVSIETLNKIKFRTPRYYTYRGKKIYFRDIQPVAVKTTGELSQLRHKYGELTNEEGLIELLEQMTGYSYTKGAIKQRRERGALAFVAYDPTKRGVYWYPVEQLKELHWQPELGKAQRKVA